MVMDGIVTLESHAVGVIAGGWPRDAEPATEALRKFYHVGWRPIELGPWCGCSR